MLSHCRQGGKLTARMTKPPGTVCPSGGLEDRLVCALVGSRGVCGVGWCVGWVPGSRFVCARDSGIMSPGRGQRTCIGERARVVWPGWVPGMNKEPPGAWCSTGGPCDGECGGVLLSHILSGAVPSPCQALASGFGLGSGRLTWAMAAANLQFFVPPSRGRGMVPGDGPGTGGWTR